MSVYRPLWTCPDGGATGLPPRKITGRAAHACGAARCLSGDPADIAADLAGTVARATESNPHDQLGRLRLPPPGAGNTQVSGHGDYPRVTARARGLPLDRALSRLRRLPTHSSNLCFLSAWTQSLVVETVWSIPRIFRIMTVRGPPTVRFSGRTYPQLARIVRALCAVAGRCW
jgi:hypothetical protein